MWIVRLALRRPYTFVILALLIAVLGILSIVTMTIDIFPRINIPVVNVIWSYGGLSPTEMQNLILTVTDQLVTVPGSAIPVPYGGKIRVVNVDIDPDALYSRGLSPQDVSNSIINQNVILPAGTAKIGMREYDVAMNGSPEILNELNHIPIR